MDKVATMDTTSRSDLFRETSARLGLLPSLIEKDFWVCWTLKHLFSIKEFSGHLLFKGGTTLSKIFHVIQRFSEDIDLAVDWEMLGFVKERNPNAAMSNTKRIKLLDEMLMACQKYISGDFIETLRARVSSILGDASSGNIWTLSVDEQDKNIIHFHYPGVIEPIGFLKPAVLLELGTHAEFIPRDNYIIMSYAAEEFPHIFDNAKCSVTAIKAERSFWEKATILHQEFYRPEDKPCPPGYSRHFYDVAKIAKSEIRHKALEDMDLLYRVVKHKKKFYPRKWARYDLAVPGTLRLTPSEIWLDSLRKDYQDMKVMIFGNAPTFDEIVEILKDLEEEINC